MNVECERPGCDQPASEQFVIFTPFGCPQVCPEHGAALLVAWAQPASEMPAPGGKELREAVSWVIDAMRFGPSGSPRAKESRREWLAAGSPR